MLKTQTKFINILPILAILGIGLILAIPLLLNGTINANDFPLHLRWSKEFSAQFWSGDFYPRWLMRMNAGLGSPIFFFYPPIPYYFTSLFKPLFTNDIQGWYPLALSTLAALVTSGWTAYLWLRTISDRKSALIASILYMVLPYHLGVDLYNRFDFTEYWAFVWMPLILYFSNKIIDGHKSNIIGLAVSYALLAMTHPSTFLIFSLFLIFYILFITVKRQRKKVVLRLLSALALGIGLSAIYWFPALAMQKDVDLEFMSRGHLSYAIDFLFIQTFPSREFLWEYLEIISLLTVGLIWCAFISTRTSSAANFRREANFWSAAAVLAIFMTLPLSRPIWEVLLPLQKIQFPWRFSTILTVATTALLALEMSQHSIRIGKKKKFYIGFLLVAGFLIGIILAIPNKTFTWYLSSVLIVAIAAILIYGISSIKIFGNQVKSKYIIIGVLLTASLLSSQIFLIKGGLYKADDPQNSYQQMQNLYKEINKESPEYRPKDVSPKNFEADALVKLSQNQPNAAVTTGQGSLTIQQWEPRKIVLKTSGTTDLLLTLKQFYYPGWTAKIQGNSYPLTVNPSKPEGLIRVGMIPSGNHEVIVTLNTRLEERIGQITSSVSAIIALVLLFWFCRSKPDIAVQ